LKKTAKEKCFGEEKVGERFRSLFKEAIIVEEEGKLGQRSKLSLNITECLPSL